MVNTCEPVQRPSCADELKWLISSNQKVREPEVDLTVPPRGRHGSSVDSRYLTPQRLQERNVETPYLSRKGTRAARRADGGAGLGGRKKRTPSCNGADTGFNVTRHESEQTSDWCLLRERMENTLNGESQVSGRWFDHPAEHPLPWLAQSLVPACEYRKGCSVEG